MLYDTLFAKYYQQARNKVDDRSVTILQQIANQHSDTKGMAALAAKSMQVLLPPNRV